MHFQFKNKGILILPVFFSSTILVFLIYAILSNLLNFEDVPHIGGLLGGISMLLAGIINSIISKNYFINAAGEKEYYEEEGTFMYIPVSIWTRIFLMAGAITLLGTIADIYKIG